MNRAMKIKHVNFKRLRVRAKLHHQHGKYNWKTSCLAFSEVQELQFEVRLPADIFKLQQKNNSDPTPIQSEPSIISHHPKNHNKNETNL